MRRSLLYQPVHAQLQFDEKFFIPLVCACAVPAVHAQLQFDEKFFISLVCACAVPA
jgi:hypothetical protein